MEMSDTRREYLIMLCAGVIPFLAGLVNDWAMALCGLFGAVYIGYWVKNLIFTQQGMEQTFHIRIDKK